MARANLLAIAVAGLAVSACETADGPGLAEVFGEVVRQLPGDAGGEAGALTTLEIEQGLREALTVGAGRVAAQLGRTDGYFADPVIRIPLPGTLGDVQERLQPVGLSGPFDDLELRMNRAAEAAVPEGRRLIVEAVQGITIQDALDILNGGDTAATDFLRARTESGLEAAFRPYVDQTLASSGAFTALYSLAGNYQLVGVSADLRSTLVDHAVAAGLDGLFHYVAVEETRIREEPVARTTEILRKVFGAQR